MSDASRLVKAMQTASQKSENEKVDIIIGTVTSVSPLKIKTDKIELTETFLVLGALCKSTTIKIPVQAIWNNYIYSLMMSTSESVYVQKKMLGMPDKLFN